MSAYTLEQEQSGKENLYITFTDILSVVNDKKNEKRWDY